MTKPIENVFLNYLSAKRAWLALALIAAIGLAATVSPSAAETNPPAAAPAKPEPRTTTCARSDNQLSRQALTRGVCHW